MLVELYVPEVVQDLHVKAAKVELAKADLKQAKETANAAKAGREAARADIEAKLATIHSCRGPGDALAGRRRAQPPIDEEGHLRPADGR